MNKLEFNNYLEEIKKFMTKVGTFKENLETNYFEDESFQELQEENLSLFKNIVEYKESYCNPAFAVKIFERELGQLLSAIYSDFRSLIKAIFTKNDNSRLCSS